MSKGEASLSALAKLTHIAIIAYIVTAIANLALTALSFYAMSNVMTPSASQDGLTGLMVVGLVASVVGILNIISIPASIILVALWVHRAFANLHEAGLEGLNYTPGWATASFFIPFVNMVVPMRALRELHNRSHGESDWHAAISVGDVTSWYACLWAAFLVGVALAAFLALDSIPYVHVLLPALGWAGLGLLFTIFVLGSAWFLLQIVNKVTAAQNAMLHYAQAGVFE